MNPEDELCDQLTARIETAVAMGKSAREMAHSILPIVLAYETKARADERAKVAEEITELLRAAPDHPTAYLRLANYLGDARDAARGGA